jgi:hypothetical protein
MRPLRLCDQPWGAVWPQDRAALVGVLSVAAAFGSLVGDIVIAVAGDLEAALADLLADLAAEGVSPDDLPRVQLAPAPDGVTLTPVALLPGALAAACEYERRPWQPVFRRNDDAHREVWAAAAEVLADDPAATVTVLAETLEGSESLLTERVRIVATSPALRRQASRAGCAAVPRPPAARHLPAADFVIADARRPDDLALVAGARAEIRLVNRDRVPGRVLAAFGLDSRRPVVGASG